MSRQLRRTVPFTRIAALAALAVATSTATAIAGNVKIGPVKGATYVGAIRESDTVTVKVAANGKSATVKLPTAPAYCQGGSGPQVQHPHPGTIKAGALTAKITYTATGSSTPFATVTVKGNFYTFSGSTPVFQGTAKTTFTKAGECNGQESFQATKT
jgi:hypothetical protein